MCQYLKSFCTCQMSQFFFAYSNVCCKTFEYFAGFDLPSIPSVVHILKQDIRKKTFYPYCHNYYL